MSSEPTTIRVVLPAHLRTLARVEGEASVGVADEPTIAAVIDALEARWPPLAGTIRDRATGRRRPLVRFLACETDVSHMGLDEPLPTAVAEGREPLHVIGAIAGG